MVDAFRMHILQTKDLGTCPVRHIGNCSFLYMRISNVYVVLVVSSNSNAALGFKFIVEVRQLKSWNTFVQVCSCGMFACSGTMFGLWGCVSSIASGSLNGYLLMLDPPTTTLP